MTPTRRNLDHFTERFLAPAPLAAAGRGAVVTLPLAGSRPHGSLRSSVRGAGLRVVEAFLAWHERARQRRALLQLSDHMLRDIGISRAEAVGEAGKPFWRA